MPKPKTPTPKVFIVPELMADLPLEPGGLLEEYLQAERAKPASTARERLEAYLQEGGVARKPAEQEWPSARQLAALSGVERQRWSTWESQHWIDTSLKKLLQGKAPREVFKLDAKRRPRPTTAARDRNMCAEVQRLVERGDYSREQAIERVAKGFGVSAQLVERAAQLWGWDARAKKERRRFVPEWEQQLRRAGKLK